MNLRNKKVLAALALFSFIFFPRDFLSAANETVGIIPAYPDPKIYASDIRFMYNLDLGKWKRDGMRVINSKNETVIVKLYPVDATTTAEGSYALMLEDDPRQGIGKWMHIAVNEIEIGPITEKTVPFTVSIPENADTGEHFGGIIMEEINNNNELLGTGVKILTRIGTRVYETVPGEVRKSYDLTRFDYSYAGSGIASFWRDLADINKRTVFFVGLKNNGNVKLDPIITLDVKNIFGQNVVHVENRDAGTIFPRGGTADATAVWDGVPILGRYTAKIKVHMTQGDVPDQEREIVIWAFPYKIGFLLVLATILVILFRLIVIYFFEAAKEGYPIYKVKLGDNLTDLSQRFLVNWKKIAKANYLEKPYEIKEGEKLFIPINRKNKHLLLGLKSEGQLELSLKERAGKSGLKKARVFAVVVALVAVGAGSFLYLRTKKVDVPAQQISSEGKKTPTETPEKTIGGAFKKSSVSMDIITLEKGEKESSERLYKKFELTGYNVVLDSQITGKYENTTIEYAPGKEEQAKMVKNDLELGKQVEIELKETSGLSRDIKVYNAVPKEKYLSVDMYIEPEANLE